MLLSRANFPLGTDRHINAGRHGQRPGDRRSRACDEHHRGTAERAEESTHRAKNFHQPIVEAQEDIPDALRIDLSLGHLTDNDILMLELIHENALDGRAQWLIFVALPDGQVLTYSVHLNGFKHQMNGRSAENATGPHDEPQLETARKVQLCERTMEEALPKLNVSLFNVNELVEQAFELTVGHGMELAVQGKVENLIQDERPGECSIVQWRIVHMKRPASKVL